MNGMKRNRTYRLRENQTFLNIETVSYTHLISKNYGTNLLWSDSSEYMVIEADEFDRSFHWLSPYICLLYTSRCV